MWCCDSLFNVAGNSILVRTYLVYNTVVRLCQFFCCGGKANLVRIFVLKLGIFFFYFLLGMDLQPYNHDSFSKNIENFVWFTRHYLLGFFILEKQLANISDRGFLVLRNTILLYSFSPYRWTESQTENKYTRFVWAGGIFFPVVLLCQFSFFGGK
jgi:hypothetical protein